MLHPLDVIHHVKRRRHMMEPHVPHGCGVLGEHVAIYSHLFGLHASANEHRGSLPTVMKCRQNRRKDDSAEERAESRGERNS